MEEHKLQKGAGLEDIDATTGRKVNTRFFCLCDRKVTYRFWNIYAIAAGQRKWGICVDVYMNIAYQPLQILYLLEKIARLWGIWI